MPALRSRRLGADQVRVLKHATSGDVTGDFSSVVGYGAAVILKTK
jgi:AmmeMemoRadiSam system protein B